MRTISRAPCALGVAIALSIGAAGVARAQTVDTTYKDSTVKTDSTGKKVIKKKTTRVRRTSATSSRRIPISKQVSTVRVDTVTVIQTVAAKPDTVFMPAPPARVETVTVVKTVQAGNVAPMLAPRRIGNFYWGLGAGASMPQGNLSDGYGVGYNVTLPFGWDAATNPLGLRVDLGYDRAIGKASAGINNDVGVWSANADLKVRMPIPGVNNASRFYVVGGGGAARVVSHGNPSTSTVAFSNPSNLSTSFSDAKTEWSWNAGAGFTFPVANAKLFVESRYIDVNSKSELGDHTRFVPLILGVIF